MTALSTRMVDARGRLTLGKEFADHLVLVKRVGEGVLQTVLAEAVPARESWLYKNPEALSMVLEGVEQAKAGDLTAGPDMEAGEQLVEDMED